MVNSSFLTVITMKVNGKMTCSIKKENIHAKMDILMRANGMKEKKKEKEFKAGKMDKSISVNLKKASNTVKES